MTEQEQRRLRYMEQCVVASLLNTTVLADEDIAQIRKDYGNNR